MAVQKTPDARRPKCIGAGVPAIIAGVTKPIHKGNAADGLYGQKLFRRQEQFHIIMETLDTEEATYIWHIPKKIQDLKLKLKEIDENLSLIRNQGRQAFLEKQPSGFSRVLHDYSDEKKGFVIWKGMVEERIV